MPQRTKKRIDNFCGDYVEQTLTELYTSYLETADYENMTSKEKQKLFLLIMSLFRLTRDDSNNT